MIMLRIHHIHDCGYCSRGARAWAQRHNFNYTEFLTVGINVERIEEVGDHFAIEVCQYARREHATQQGVSNG